MTALAILVVCGAALGLWALRRSGDAVEFFAAGRRAGPWLVGIAGTAAGVSAFTFVGGPGLFLAAGAGSLWIVLSTPVTGALQCWAVGERIVADAAREHIVTVPQILARRFGRGAHGVAAVVVAIGCVATLAVQARAAAVLGESLLGLDGGRAAALIMLATVAYTALGGMRAGLWADAAQGAVMGCVAVALAVAAVMHAGGPGEILATLRTARPELLGSFGTIPPSQAAAWYLLFAVGTAAQPHYLQKFLFVRDAGALRRLPAVLTLALAVTLTVWIGIGFSGAALVARGALTVAHGDDVAPRLVAALGPVAATLAGIAVIAALMSTAASLLNLAAAAVTRDLPEAFGRPAYPVATARWTTLAVAAAATWIGVASTRAVAILGIAGWGFFTAALLPALTLGLAWRGASRRGVVAGMVAGAAVAGGLELFRGSLPPALEPGLAGAAVGTLALLALSRSRP